MEMVIELFIFLYYHKGTTGITMVMLAIWHEFGLSDAFLFLGIVLMIVGVVDIIVKAID